MSPKERQECDQLFCVVFGRLINSVLARGSSTHREQSHEPASRTAADVTATPTQAASVVSLRLRPGTILAHRYRIAYLLGRGGTGEVYRADDLLLGQAVAVKLLSATGAGRALALNCFRNEVRVARQISHPNICRVYDIGEAEGLTYLTMEYVDGENLASLLQRMGKLPRDRALEIGRQICAGLAAAHDNGVVHRDLKPANIMLDAKGHVRITDFGLAGASEQIQDVCSGTPGYMSPEQVAGQGVTVRSDIYVLGIVLHELLTGRRPPIEPDDEELETAVKKAIDWSLDPDPQKRPACAMKVAAALCNGHRLPLSWQEAQGPIRQSIQYCWVR
jgi:serine/threonine protein kinase